MEANDQEDELDVLKRRLENLEWILSDEDYQSVLEEVKEFVKGHMKKAGMEYDENL